MSPTISTSMTELIQQILSKGNRVEIMIENGQVTIVEIKRKLRAKGETTK